MLRQYWLRMTLGLLVALALVTTDARAQGDIDVEMVMEELTETLELSDEQAQAVAGHLQAFGLAMAAASEAAEAEDADGDEMISGLKVARSDYQESMQGTLSKEQYETYEAFMDEVMQDIFESIAELKITDLEQPLELTSDQAAALKPVMGTGIRELIAVIFEYSDKRISL